MVYSEKKNEIILYERNKRFIYIYMILDLNPNFKQNN